MSKAVLVVDDSASMRQLVSFTLRRAGFQTLEAVDGLDALERLAANRVDLILTDLNMPRLDGIGLIREVRRRPGTRTTPVLMLTTESQESKRQEGRAAGATGWLVKPFQPDKLIQVIGRVLP
jgi:two-component system chemotaxis response regulator CheY